MGTSFTFTILSPYSKSKSCFQFVLFKKFPSRYWSQETTGDGLGHLFIRESRPLPRIHPIFFFLGVQLIYNVVLISAVQQSDSVIHIIIFHIFSIGFIMGYWIYFPVLYSRTLLLTHPICTSFHLLIPDCSSIHPLHASPLATASLFSSVSIS